MPIKSSARKATKVGPVTVRKPRTSAKALPHQQKPVKTPMKRADQHARVKATKVMSRRGTKGPVKYK